MEQALYAFLQFDKGTEADNFSHPGNKLLAYGVFFGNVHPGVGVALFNS